MAAKDQNKKLKRSRKDHARSERLSGTRDGKPAKPARRAGAVLGSERVNETGATVERVFLVVGSAQAAAPQPAAPRRPRQLGRLEGKMTVPARVLPPLTEEELREWGAV